MGKAIDQALKNYMQEHFPFSDFKKIGFFSKGMKFNDYEAQAKRVCVFFGFESVYEYSKKEIKAHISYVRPGDKIGMDSSREILVNEKGDLTCKPFVETFFPNSLHI